MKSLLDLLVPPPPVRRFGDTYAVEALDAFCPSIIPEHGLSPKQTKRATSFFGQDTCSELVATLWIGPRPDGDSIAVHIDGNKLNNAVDNICWKNKNV